MTYMVCPKKADTPQTFCITLRMEQTTKWTKQYFKYVVSDYFYDFLEVGRNPLTREKQTDIVAHGSGGKEKIDNRRQWGKPFAECFGRELREKHRQRGHDHKTTTTHRHCAYQNAQ